MEASRSSEMSVVQGEIIIISSACKQRNRIERMWCRLKDWRRIATRYDKLAKNYLSAAFIAAAVTYWPN